jgi:hypothetical protein
MALNIGSIVGGALKSVAGGDKAEGTKRFSVESQNDAKIASGNPVAELMNKKVADQAKLAKELTGLLTN